MKNFKTIVGEVVVFSSLIALVLISLITKFSYIDLGYLFIVVIYFMRFLYIDIKGEKEQVENDF